MNSITQDGPNKLQTSDYKGNEKALTNILKEQELKREPQKVLVALRQLTDLSRMKLVKSPETYVVLTRFLDFEVSEPHAATPSQLDTHPAALALYYGGEDALPYLADVISRESGSSPKSSLALWTVIYIKNDDFRLAYAYLNEAARNPKTRTGKERLLIAAKKAAAYDPEIPK